MMQAIFWIALLSFSGLKAMAQGSIGDPLSHSHFERRLQQLDSLLPEHAVMVFSHSPSANPVFQSPYVIPALAPEGVYVLLKDEVSFRGRQAGRFFFGEKDPNLLPGFAHCNESDWLAFASFLKQTDSLSPVFLEHSPYEVEPLFLREIEYGPSPKGAMLLDSLNDSPLGTRRAHEIGERFGKMSFSEFQKHRSEFAGYLAYYPGMGENHDLLMMRDSRTEKEYILHRNKVYPDRTNLWRLYPILLELESQVSAEEVAALRAMGKIMSEAFAQHQPFPRSIDHSIPSVDDFFESKGVNKHTVTTYYDLVTDPDTKKTGSIPAAMLGSAQGIRIGMGRSHFQGLKGDAGTALSNKLNEIHRYRLKKLSPDLRLGAWMGSEAEVGGMKWFISSEIHFVPVVLRPPGVSVMGWENYVTRKGHIYAFVTTAYRRDKGHEREVYEMWDTVWMGPQGAEILTSP